MTTIPEMCMQYASVFQTVRIEMFAATALGLLIGITACGGWKK